MSVYRELAYNVSEIDTVSGVQFCVLSPDDIRSRSAVEVTNHQTYSYNQPVQGGLFDKRMGVIEYKSVCQTCEQTNAFCPGHFGHIELARPVFHVHFFNMVMRIVHCICYCCSRVPFAPDNAHLQTILSKRLSRQKRWELVYKLCYKAKECPYCQAKQPDKVSRSGLRMEMEWRGEDKAKVVLTAEDVLRMLRRMTDEDIALLGFDKTHNRPEWMICTVLLVPPPSVRPTVKNDVGQRQEDDLTTKLVTIVKYNAAIKAALERDNAGMSNTYYSLMQYEVATMIDNNAQGINPSKIIRTGRPIRALTERLKSKEGRIRGNLMGKRVDFSARSVITPDPNISIDELGVPLKIAVNLTIPEIVSRWTRERLAALVRSGPGSYPGAKFVHKVREGNRTIRLKGFADDPARLDEVARDLADGDTVDRHLLDGDYVLFNRQPSLHKMSMMAHRVRVMPFNTFRLNVVCTPSFNADFDGDEMNMHVPQSAQTREELTQLAAVTRQIISPRECKPIISIVQDIALGVYRMTRPGASVTRRQLMNLVSPNAAAEVDFAGCPEVVSGRDVLSTVLPRGLTTTAGGIVVVDGKIAAMLRPVTKSTYQERSNGLVQSVHNELGREATRKLFDDTQQLVCDFLVLDGFSVGVSDLLVSQSTIKKFHDVMDGMHRDVEGVIRSLHEGRFENQSAKRNNEYFERVVNKTLNGAVSTIGKMAMSEVGESDNRLVSMISAGSKGNNINVAQMVGCVGQQNVDSKRIPYSFDSRTLPHYCRYDDGPESRGFVKNSFISGLTPQEFFFHSMGGREGLIDTAVKTSETGYIQRKLVKAMEDFKVSRDGTVRNANGTILQFMYGEDGMDPIAVELQRLPTLTMTPAEVEREYAFHGGAEHVRQLLHDRRFVLGTMMAPDHNGDEIEFPVHIARIVDCEACSRPSAKGKKLARAEVLAAIESLQGMKVFGREPPPIWGVLVRALLSPRVVEKKLKHSASFARVVEKIEERFLSAIMDPSEMVGVVAAQSISEPCTQLTLNTFHMSGVASASQGVRGVQRLKEIIDCTASKNMKTPGMLIYMQRRPDGGEAERDAVLSMMVKLKVTRFKDIVKRSRIYFDPAETAARDTVVSEVDAKFVKMYSAFSEREHLAKFSPWVVRLTFDRKRMFELDLAMADVDHVLQEIYGDRISVVFTDDNSTEVAMRIRLNASDAQPGGGEGGGLLTELRALEHNILYTHAIGGVPNIERVVVDHPLTRTVYDAVADAHVARSEFVIQTEGSNLRDVLGFAGIDQKRTTTNDIQEIYRTLGIEAARQVLYDEIHAVLEQNYINYRHVSLLVDTITNKGRLVSVNRHGINQGDNGPLAKCSFEETVVRLVNAGIFAERDRVNGVSANIMLGQMGPCGTGDSRILVDTDMLPPPPFESAVDRPVGEALADSLLDFDGI